MFGPVADRRADLQEVGLLGAYASHHNAALGSRYRSFDKEEVLVLVNRDHGERARGDPAVAHLCQKAAETLAEHGVEVVEAHPDFSDAHDVFQTLRAHGFASSMDDLYHHHRDLLKPEVIWNIERGLNLTAEQLADAERKRGRIYAHAADFMAEYDLLLTPATIVPPYPVEERYVRHCNGVDFDTYIDWLAIAYAITLTSLPALSLPCGMTDQDLPVGLQVVGKPRGEAKLLSHARWIETILGRMATPMTPKG